MNEKIDELINAGFPIIMRNREGCAGGGKGLMYSEKSFTLATSNDQILILDGTRVNDVRVYQDDVMQTVIQRWGTGGGNVPMVFEPKSAFEENWAESEVKNTLRSNASKSSHAVVEQSVVRRLTPVECERLQGFPDGWTEGQADSNRYKQMGNAVAVPVVEWIVGNLVEEIK